MTTELERVDPLGLIREAYAIEDITPEDCRTIFFNWAIGLGEAGDKAADIAVLLAAYGATDPDHPMTLVLREGREKSATPARRRGGSRARRG